MAYMNDSWKMLTTQITTRKKLFRYVTDNNNNNKIFPLFIFVPENRTTFYANCMNLPFCLSPNGMKCQSIYLGKYFKISTVQLYTQHALL